MEVYLVEHGNYHEYSQIDSVHATVESARIRVNEILSADRLVYIQSPDDEDTWVEERYCQDYISILEYDLQNLKYKLELTNIKL